MTRIPPPSMATGSPVPSGSSPSMSGPPPPPTRLRHPLPQPPVACALPPIPSRTASSSASSSSSSSNRSRPMQQQHSLGRGSKSPHHSGRSQAVVSASNRSSSSSPSFYQSTSPFYSTEARASGSSSHPSPASTTSSSSSSAGSSLRTPPDLLLNGNTIGYSGLKTSPQHHPLPVNSWNGLLVKPKIPAKKLNVEDIKRRKHLLQSLPQLPASWELPSPPPSPKPIARPAAEVETSSSSKQRSAPSADDDSSRTSGSSKRRRVDDERPSIPKKPAAVAPNAPSIRPLPSNGPASLSPRSASHLAAIYRTAARDLKHSADARTSSRSPSTPSYLASRPTNLSALEQLDAVLLFCYAFWLDDQALGSTGSCVAKNWISLFGLLRYATNAQSDLSNDVLLGLCRLVESAVLRKLHAHDSTLLQRKLENNRSSSSLDLEEISKLVTQQLADLERSDRLLSQSRNLISLSNLASYPETLDLALKSTIPSTEVAARTLDPANHHSSARFSFPLDSTSPMPHIICFGRRLVGEHAKINGVEGFTQRDVDVVES